METTYRFTKLTFKNESLSLARILSIFESAKHKISTRLFIRNRLIPILLILTLIIIYLSLDAIHTHLILSVYKTPISMTNQPIYKQFYTSYANFLQNQNVRTLIQIQCTLNCFVSSKQEQLQVFDVKYVDYLHQIYVDSEQVSIYADWVNYYGPAFTQMIDQQVEAQAEKLRRISRMGLAIIWDYTQFNRMSRDEITRIRLKLESKNLSYNTIESLQLRRMEGMIIEIYTRFSKLSQSFDGAANEYNLIAIQAELKLQRDIPFLREWIGYHSTIGVDKFFIYRLPDDTEECSGLTHAEVEGEWAKIWGDYATSIVYIPWRPTPVTFPYPLSLIFPQQPNSQHDYIYNYAKQIRYSIFLSTDSVIFSKIGLKLSKTLVEMKRYDSFKLEVRNFLQRYCAGSKYMLQNYQYYDYGSANTNSVIMFSTQSYDAVWGTRRGSISDSNSYKFSSRQWRINKYSFSKNDLKQVQATQKYPNMYLSFDFSAESRLPLVARICDYKYGITVEQTCDAGGLSCINRHGKII